MIYIIWWIIIVINPHAIMLLGYILKDPQDKDAIYECIATGLILVSWPLLALVLLPTIFVKFLKYYKNKTKVVKK